MGGYGALRNGLKYHETFGAIAALSTANVVATLDQYTDDAPVFFQGKPYIEALFGPVAQIPGSDKDLLYLADRLADVPDKPKIYLACGQSDHLLPVNRALAHDLEARHFAVTYREAPGDHEWDFWDSQIRQVVEWLPLGGAAAGVNSGNVGV